MLTQTSFFVAEVMDKEPTLVFIWVSAMTLAILGWAASLFRWWTGLIVATISAILSILMLLELHDPFVGPAIRTSRSYFVQAYLAMFVALALPLIASLIAKRRASQHPDIPTS